MVLFFKGIRDFLRESAIRLRLIDGCSLAVSGQATDCVRAGPQDAIGEPLYWLPTRDSAWRRRAFGNVLFHSPNFLKVLNFQFTLNRPLYPR
jgi:hypothetical protein